MDLICGDYRNNMSTERTSIVNAVHQGLLPESVVDTALRRLFTARFRLGMFDPPPLFLIPKSHRRKTTPLYTTKSRSAWLVNRSSSSKIKTEFFRLRIHPRRSPSSAPTQTTWTRSKAITMALRQNPSLSSPESASDSRNPK